MRGIGKPCIMKSTSDNMREKFSILDGEEKFLALTGKCIPRLRLDEILEFWMISVHTSVCTDILLVKT